MKKSDHKKKSREVKSADRQKKHTTKVTNQLGKREEKQKHYMNLMVKKSQKTAEMNSKDERLKEQLQRNMEILAALEKQMEEEEQMKKKVNEDLEAKGFQTLEEKMKFLQDQAVEMQKAQGDISNEETQGTTFNSIDELFDKSEKTD